MRIKGRAKSPVKSHCAFRGVVYALHGARVNAAPLQAQRQNKERLAIRDHKENTSNSLAHSVFGFPSNDYTFLQKLQVFLRMAWMRKLRLTT
jgi:hypothetical protein